jgi:hypothetical protein
VNFVARPPSRGGCSAGGVIRFCIIVCGDVQVYITRSAGKGRGKQVAQVPPCGQERSADRSAVQAYGRRAVL